MRRSDREMTDKNKMLDIVKTGRYAVVALCRQDEPYVVTMSYGYEEQTDTFYFHGAGKGQKIDFIKANPNACLTVIRDDGYQYGRCTHAYGSVVCRGKMVLVDDRQERIHAMKAMIRQLEPLPEEQLAKVDDGDAVWRQTQMFKLVVESMTGKERPKIK